MDDIEAHLSVGPSEKRLQFLPLIRHLNDEGDSTGKVDPNMIAIVPTYSQQETLRYKDFAEMTGESHGTSVDGTTYSHWFRGNTTI